MSKLNAAGSALLYSTYLGGFGSDNGRGIALDASSAAYTAGYAGSNNFPTTVGAYQTTFRGTYDAFLSKLNLTQAAPASVTAVSGASQSSPVNGDFLVLIALVTDSAGNPVPGVPVTFTPPASGASAILFPTTATTGCDGRATTPATANTIAGAYTVTAAVTGVATPAAFNLTNLAGAAANLTYVTQPANSTAGSPIVPVTVQLTDAYNNPIGGASITIGLVAGGPLNGATPQTTNASGRATFSNLSINTVGTYQFLATAAGGPSATSNSFNITAAFSWTISALSGSGQTAPLSTAYASPLRAKVEDAFGNAVSGVQVTFAAPGSGASGTFAATPTVATDSSGIATAPTITANTTVGAFTVTATIPSHALPQPVLGASSTTFTLTNVTGTANKLAFAQQPSNTAAGQPIAPAVTVQLQDSFGNAAATAGIAISLQLITGNVFGTATQITNASGLAMFPDLNVQQVGQYQLLATASGMTSATSSMFTIRAGSASNFRATRGTPQSARILAQFALPLEVTVDDAYGNPISGLPINYSAPSSGASATLSAFSATTDASGRASVTSTANDTVGSYSVTALLGNALINFQLTNTPGSPGQILFIQQPTNTAAGAPITPPVVARVLDALGNPFTGTLTLSILGGSATLNGTVTGATDANGEATFSDLSVNRSGTYNLLGVIAGLSGVSSGFTISAASGVMIYVYQGDGQSAATGSQYSGPLKALVSDPLGNAISGASVTFATPVAGASVTFAGPATVTTDAAGIATSPGLTANSTAGAVQVSATTQGAASPAVFNLTNIAGSGNRLMFVQQPTDTTAGQTITPAVTVQLVNSSGNPLNTAGVPIAVQANAVLQRRRLFAGNATQNTDANGVATFSNLSIALASAYQLQASAAGTASATSNPFKIVAGVPAAILPTGGASQSAFVMTVFGAPLQATVTDAAGNPIAGVPVVFTAPASGASGTMGGQLTVTATTDAQGRASAVLTANSIAGSYNVVASSTAVTGSATFTLTNLPLTARGLSFLQQPTNTVAGEVIAPPVRVQLRNAAGQPVNAAGVAIVLSLYSGTGTLFGGVVQVTDASGTATFSDLRIGAVGPKQLRAASAADAPVNSNSFLITAAAAATITAISGTPQATYAGQPFPSLLQAKVADGAGNPVSGTVVTFAVPASGPGGTFAGPATVTTDSNGIATAPVLTANQTLGSSTASASAAGVTSPAIFALTILPQSGALMAAPAQLSFSSEINQPAPPGQVVQLTSASGAALNWSASTSAPWLQVSPASGATPGQATVTVNPAGLAVGSYSGSIVFTSPTGGATAVLVRYMITNQPALVVTPPLLVFTTPNNTVIPASRMLEATSSSAAIGYRVTAQVSTPEGGNWLRVSAAQGRTPGTVQVSVVPTGLSEGIYDGSVLFTPTDSTINSVAVPVTLVIGCGQGGCPTPRPGAPLILAVTNAASFRPNGAPAAIMSIFGFNLSDATYQAPAYPLPTQLGPTRVTVNGVPAPLFYVSPRQINFQMPSITPTGAPEVVVNMGLLTATSRGYPASVTPVDPGLFVTPDRRASALNQDLSVHTAATPQPAGALIVLYMTGPGPLNPPLPDGTAAPPTPLSLISGMTQVTIGGREAQVVYAGEAPGFAGLQQINAIIPTGLAPGNQPVFVTVNGVASNAGAISVR